MKARVDHRVLHPKRIPCRWPLLETITALMAIKIFEIESPWTYVIAIILAGLWFAAMGRKHLERKIDPFDLEA